MRLRLCIIPSLPLKSVLFLRGHYVTVHLVDKGIDTGNILEQEIIHPQKNDNYVTYPLLQLAAGIPCLKRAIKNVFDNQSQTKEPPGGESKLWSHPTLQGYLWRRIRFGVK